MSSSFADSTFDYRSLLPTRNVEGSDQSEAASDDNEVCCGFLPDLSWRERLMGCATCMIAGYILSMGSMWRIKDLLKGNPYPFVLNATIGNVLSLSGSCFLSGPKAQLKKMFHESRKIATVAYLGSLLLTLFVAFVDPPGPTALVLLLLMFCQYIAITWYCLSYIPFARDAVKALFRRWFGQGDEF